MVKILYLTLQYYVYGCIWLNDDPVKIRKHLMIYIHIIVTLPFANLKNGTILYFG